MTPCICGGGTATPPDHRDGCEAVRLHDRLKGIESDDIRIGQVSRFLVAVRDAERARCLRLARASHYGGKRHSTRYEQASGRLIARIESGES